MDYRTRDERLRPRSGECRVVYHDPEVPEVAGVTRAMILLRNRASSKQIDSLQKRGGFSQYMRVRRGH